MTFTKKIILIIIRAGQRKKIRNVMLGVMFLRNNSKTKIFSILGGV
jgi:hypothetical protein